MMSPEVAADAAEPLGVVTLTAVSPEVLMPASDSYTVVSPSKELFLVPYETTVEPPEVAASAAEPSEVSVVLNYELPICPVTVRETVSELPAYPVTARGAVPESSSCPVTAMEAVCESTSCEPSSCPVTAMEPVCESSSFEPSSCPVTAMEAVYELLPCSELVMEANYELLSCPDPTEEAASERSALYVTPKDAVC